MSNTTPKLYYVHDPMCSWCWGFRRTWNDVQKKLADSVDIIYLLGGLAPDSKQIMPEDMKTRIQGAWYRIQEEIPGTEFNFKFWDECEPRRSTYAACRAVIAARKQHPKFEKRMILAIQQAYYLHAKNPSDNLVLCQLAKVLGINTANFKQDLESEDTRDELANEVMFSKTLPVSGFPSLVLVNRELEKPLKINYTDPESIIKQILSS